MNKETVFWILLVFSILFSCAPIEHENSDVQSEALYKIGVAYLQENKIQQAFVEFQKAYDLNPKNKEVLNAIGIIYLLHFYETEKAIDFFQKALTVDPQYSEAYNNLGFAHEKLGNYEKAIMNYKRAVSNLLYSTPEKAYINMGNSYYRLRKYEDAISAFLEAIKRAPNVSLPYLRLALCYNAVGQYGDASAAMTKAIMLDSVYRGSRDKAAADLMEKKMTATGVERQDIIDFLEILKY